MATKYNVSLSNKDCIFDSMDGFDTIQELLDWASDRGESYVLQIAREDNGVENDWISVAAKCVDGKMYFSRYIVCEWVPVDAKSIAKMI